MRHIASLVIAVGIAQVALAAAPIVSASPASPKQQYVNANTQDLTFDQQHAQMNKLAQLQQQMRRLQGTLEEQQHQLTLLQQQQMTLYHDLDKRLMALSATPTKTTLSTPTHQQPSGIAVTTDQPANSGNAQEQNAYQAAYHYIQSKHYTQATTAFQQFLQDYPNGRYAANAYYWLGQLAIIQGDLSTARKQFNNVVKRHSTSTKAADALFKLGDLDMIEQHPVQAKQTFQNVIKQYPNTPAAKLAQQKLAQLARAG